MPIDYGYQQRSVHDLYGSTNDGEGRSGIAPGKRTLTRRLPARSEAMQRKAARLASMESQRVSPAVQAMTRIDHPAANAALGFVPEDLSVLDLPVQRKVLQASCSCGGTCSSCRARSGDAQRLEDPESVGTARPIQAAGLRGNPEAPVRLPGHGGGAEMPEDVRAKMEAALGVDFSPVRIHVGPHAQEVGALAYTQGTDIHFAPGQYQPESQRGQRLLGHELTHVVQQSHGGVRATSRTGGVAVNDDASLEQEADEMGGRAASGEVVQQHIGSMASPRADSSVVQRCAGGIDDATPREVPLEFTRSGFDESVMFEERYPWLRNPWSSDMEHELSRLSRYAMGYANQGRSSLFDPYYEIESREFQESLDAQIRQFVELSLADGTDVDRDRLVELVGAYVRGYDATTPSNEQIEDNVERQHGGYDAMAALLAGHTGTRNPDEWRLTDSQPLMQFLHDMGYWQDLDRRVVNAAEREYALWTDQNDPQCQQRHESRAEFGRLEAYWRAAGRRGPYARSSAERSRDGDKSYPWSAAFISYVMRQAGAADTFHYAAGHAVYAADAGANNGRSRVTHPSRLLDANSEPVHIGSLLHRNRKDGTPNVTYDSVRSGYQTHADIVVDIEIYDAEGNRLHGPYQDILNNADSTQRASYQIFAVTIGGNTSDQTLGPAGEDMETARRSGETVGRHYWKLNPDLTIDNDVLTWKAYGIQRMDHPPRSDETPSTRGQQP